MLFTPEVTTTTNPKVQAQTDLTSSQIQSWLPNDPSSHVTDMFEKHRPTPGCSCAIFPGECGHSHTCRSQGNVQGCLARALSSHAEDLASPIRLITLVGFSLERVKKNTTPKRAACLEQGKARRQGLRGSIPGPAFPSREADPPFLLSHNPPRPKSDHATREQPREREALRNPQVRVLRRLVLPRAPKDRENVTVPGGSPSLGAAGGARAAGEPR